MTANMPRRRQIIALLTFFLAMMVMLTACDLGVDEDACRTDTALLVDDFENGNACGWTIFDNNGLTTEIVDGNLLITTSQAGMIAWTNVNRDFTNVIIDVEARQVAGPDNNGYGVICRYRNEENFYVFLVSGDGYYTIGKYESGVSQIEYLTPNNEWAYSDLVNQGVAQNSIRASCIGDELSLAVNGIPVFTANDATHTSGDVGIGASTLEPGETQIRFDDFRVVEP